MCSNTVKCSTSLLLPAVSFTDCAYGESRARPLVPEYHIYYLSCRSSFVCNRHQQVLCSNFQPSARRQIASRLSSRWSPVSTSWVQLDSHLTPVSTLHWRDPRDMHLPRNPPTASDLCVRIQSPCGVWAYTCQANMVGTLLPPTSVSDPDVDSRPLARGAEGASLLKEQSALRPAVPDSQFTGESGFRTRTCAQFPVLLD